MVYPRLFRTGLLYIGSVLYQVVQEHLETLLAQAKASSAQGYGYPRYVEEVRPSSREASRNIIYLLSTYHYVQRPQEINLGHRIQISRRKMYR
jgi:hypothetical protein